METIWEILGIQKTKDRKQIKKAYSEQVKLHHPEDDPQGFEKLRNAYAQALQYAKFGSDTVYEEWMQEDITEEEQQDKSITDPTSSTYLFAEIDDETKPQSFDITDENEESEEQDTQKQSYYTLYETLNEEEQRQFDAMLEEVILRWKAIVKGRRSKQKNAFIQLFAQQNFQCVKDSEAFQQFLRTYAIRHLTYQRSTLKVFTATFPLSTYQDEEWKREFTDFPYVVKRHLEKNKKFKALLVLLCACLGIILYGVFGNFKHEGAARHVETTDHKSYEKYRDIPSKLKQKPGDNGKIAFGFDDWDYNIQADDMIALNSRLQIFINDGYYWLYDYDKQEFLDNDGYLNVVPLSPQTGKQIHYFAVSETTYNCDVINEDGEVLANFPNPAAYYRNYVFDPDSKDLLKKQE